MDISLSAGWNGHADTCLDRKSPDLEYTDDTVLHMKTGRFQVFLDRVDHNVGIFRMYYYAFEVENSIARLDRLQAVPCYRKSWVKWKTVLMFLP